MTDRERIAVLAGVIGSLIGRLSSFTIGPFKMFPPEDVDEYIRILETVMPEETDEADA